MSAPTANGHAAPPPADAPATSAQTSKVQPNDVGWQFVPQYYNFVNKQPHRLHCFYNKRSTFIHGEEGEDATVALGQQAIFERITAIGYEQCKVYIHSIDSQSSANGGIIILVIGEMSNNNQPWRKFTQTFFLAEQPNGYFVLNDIFRYLKEEEEDEEEGETPQEIPVVPVEVPIAAPIQTVQEPEPKQEEVTVDEPTPEPEPVSAPAPAPTNEVPEEAVIASVPDKDVAPSEPATAVEEPSTSAPAPAPIEETPPAKIAPSPTPAPAAPKSMPNGNATPSPAAPAAAPAPAASAAPAKPAAPKSWAAMAAGNKPAAAASAAVSAPAPASTPSPAPAAPAPKKEEAPAAGNASAPSQGRHPYYENAMRVQTPHCFVKLPNWSTEAQNGGETLDENTVRNTAIRFGDVAKVEIVKQKACAFVEFKTVESARKAIVASLGVSQGGEGGVKVPGQEGRLNFETRKEKDERRPKGGNRGGAPERTGSAGAGQAPGPGAGAGGGGGAGRGGADGSRRDGPGGGAGAGRGRGRGRGGPPGGGSGSGGDRPRQ